MSVAPGWVGGSVECSSAFFRTKEAGRRVACPVSLARFFGGQNTHSLERLPSQKALAPGDSSQSMRRITGLPNPDRRALVAPAIASGTNRGI